MWKHAVQTEHQNVEAVKAESRPKNVSSETFLRDTKEENSFVQYAVSYCTRTRIHNKPKKRQFYGPFPISDFDLLKQILTSYISF